MRARLLIADEPTTALDVTIQAQILDLLHDLQHDTGLGILLITHDLAVVAEMCDRVYVMYAGEIVEQTDVRTLFANPEHPYTKGLIASAPVPGGRKDELDVIPGNVPNPSTAAGLPVRAKVRIAGGAQQHPRRGAAPGTPADRPGARRAVLAVSHGRRQSPSGSVFVPGRDGSPPRRRGCTAGANSGEIVSTTVTSTPDRASRTGGSPAPSTAASPVTEAARPSSTSAA